MVAGSRDHVPVEERSPQAAEKAQADLRICLRMLDDALEGRPFLLGDYTLADTHLQGFVGWVGGMDVDLAPFANVFGWLDRCGGRPALAALFQ